MLEIIHGRGGLVTVTLPERYPTSKQVALHSYYAVGMIPQRYPVPVIRQHHEFGWSLTDSAPVLLHCIQGVYDG